MRKSLWVILTALLVAIGTPNAHADTCPPTDVCTLGTIPFQVLAGSPTPSGIFLFDGSTNTLVTLQVMWDGITFSETDPLFNVTVTPGTSFPSDCPNLTGLIVADITRQSSLITRCKNSALNDHESVMDPDATAILTWVINYDSTVSVSITDSVQIPAPIGDSFAGYIDNPIVTPELGTASLMVAGIGFMLVIRKRIGPSLPPAS
ncbi:MAG: hypothetical protein WB780_08385 [Candidatus Acidiferrales bacterium]